MDNLEPITRNEMFLNGDDLEPITREEMILAGADLEPITRHEWFLKRYRGGGGGGGYDLVNVPNLPADIASFNDGTDLPMASLKVSVTPYQDLSHGNPSPENICPIIGWDEAVVTVADDAESPTTSHEYTIDLDGTRYGGVVDATNGTMTVDRVIASALTWTSQSTATQMSYYSYVIDNIKKPAGASALIGATSSDYIEAISSSFVASGDGKFCISQFGRINVNDNRYATVEEFTNAMENIQICYELATPITVQLSPTQVKSLEGENNISANCGQITEVKYFKKA